jgi:uncharacterized membrane protein YbhN (UPF0104 family)
MRRFHRRTILVVASVAALLYAGALIGTLLNTEVPDLTWIDWMMLLAASTGEIAAKYMFGMQFRHGVIETGGKLHAASAFKAALVGAGVARLIPAGGAVTPVAMAWIVRKEARGTGGSAVRATVLNYAGLLIATGFALLWVVNRGLYQSLEAGTWVIGIIALAIGLVLMFGTRWIGLLSSRLPGRLREMLGPPTDSHIPDIRSQGWLWGRLALEATSLFLVMEAFDLHLTPMQTVAAFGISQLAGGLPGTPGGIGFTEFGLVGALAAFGYGPELTLAPVLVFRVVSYWIPLVAGFVAGGSAFLKEETVP